MLVLRRLLSTQIPKPPPVFLKNFKGELIPPAAQNAFEANSRGLMNGWIPREAAPGAFNQFVANQYVRHGHGQGRLAKRRVPLQPGRPQFFASRY